MSGRLTVRGRGVRTSLAALAVVLPRRLRRFVLTRLLGYDIPRSASVGHAFIDVDRLVMGEHARIGHLVALRGCEEVVLGERAVVLMLVWVNSVREARGFFEGHDRRPALLMGRHALITSMHFIDACDLVELADYACVAGFGSMIQTHAVDFASLRQSSAPVRIGERSLVASRSLILPGAEVPDRSIVAAGSVVNRKLAGHHMFAGVPARAVRELDGDEGFFVRTTSEAR